MSGRAVIIIIVVVVVVVKVRTCLRRQSGPVVVERAVGESR